MNSQIQNLTDDLQAMSEAKDLAESECKRLVTTERALLAQAARYFEQSFDSLSEFSNFLKTDIPNRFGHFPLLAEPSRPPPELLDLEDEVFRLKTERDSLLSDHHSEVNSLKQEIERLETKDADHQRQLSLLEGEVRGLSADLRLLSPFRAPSAARFASAHAASEAEQRRGTVERLKREMDVFFNMTEDDYGRLSDAEKADADTKREHFRNYFIEHNGDLTDYEPPGRAPDHRDTKGKTQSRRPRAVRGAVPSDPLLQSVILFEYTLCRLAERVRGGGATFRALNPSVLMPGAARAPPPPPAPPARTARKGELAPVLPVVADANVLLVSAADGAEAVMAGVAGYLPTLAKLKEGAATKLITPARLEVPEMPAVDLLEAPAGFSLVAVAHAGDAPPPPRGTSTLRRTRRGGRLRRARVCR
jgi:hypothetical protein